MPQPAISIRGVAKAFGPKIAVNGLSLDIPAGTFYGLVGPNGAGKTTLMSMISGLLRPDFGDIWVNGTHVWSQLNQAKAQMGVLTDGAKVFDRLTGEQLIIYSGLLRGLDRDTVHQRTTDLLGLMELHEDANKMVVDYSAGMTKKVALAAAMIHSPKILLLDEPFESVDPVSAARIRKVLEQYVNQGGTVLISSHVMDLVQRMCSHVAVIHQGMVHAAGTVDEVRAGKDLDDRFVELVGGSSDGEGLSWLGA